MFLSTLWSSERFSSKEISIRRAPPLCALTSWRHRVHWELFCKLIDTLFHWPPLSLKECLAWLTALEWQSLGSPLCQESPFPLSTIDANMRFFQTVFGGRHHQDQHVYHHHVHQGQASPSGGGVFNDPSPPAGSPSESILTEVEVFCASVPVSTGPPLQNHTIHALSLRLGFLQLRSFGLLLALESHFLVAFDWLWCFTVFLRVLGGQHIS